MAFMPTLLHFMNSVEPDQVISVVQGGVSFIAAMCTANAEAEDPTRHAAVCAAGMLTPGIDAARVARREKAVRTEEDKGLLTRRKKQVEKAKQERDELHDTCAKRQVWQNFMHLVMAYMAFAAACEGQVAVGKVKGKVRNLKEKADKQRALREAANNAFLKACADATALFSTGQYQAEVAEQFQSIAQKAVKTFKEFFDFSAMLRLEIDAARELTRIERRRSVDGYWNNAARAVTIGADLAFTIATRGKRPPTMWGAAGFGLGCVGMGFSVSGLLIEAENIEECDRIFSACDALQAELAADAENVKSFLEQFAVKEEEVLRQSMEVAKAEARKEAMAEARAQFEAEKEQMRKEWMADMQRNSTGT